MRANRAGAGAVRGWAERGATLVEYVLIVAAVAGLGLIAVRFLTSEGSAEVTSQADCVSTRPPPPSCLRPVLTTTTTVDLPTTETTEAPTTTTPTTTPPSTTPPSTTPPSTTPPSTTPPTTQPPVRWGGNAGWEDNASFNVNDNGRWYFRIDVELSGSGPIEDYKVVVVRYTVIDPAGGETGTVTCTTDDDGECELRVPPTQGNNNARFASNIREVRLEYVTIDGLAPPANAPTKTVTKPR